jgi:transposase
MRPDLSGFAVLPKRWIVERNLAWISRNRRLCATTSAAPARLPP